MPSTRKHTLEKYNTTTTPLQNREQHVVSWNIKLPPTNEKPDLS